MNKLRVSRHQFSKLFWKVVLQNSESFLHNGWPQLREDLDRLERLRGQAEYNTGSINLSAAFVLHSICNYFHPKSVAEVGTFIGKSTLSMARGMEGRENTAIHTCDYSNDIELNLPTSVAIVQYKKQSSTQMFTAIKNLSVQTDLLALDGRLSKEDLPLIQAIAHQRTIVALDDFEGIEKGVANAMLLTSAAHFKNHLLIYPTDEITLRGMGFEAGCTTALLMPAQMIMYTAQ
jgi:predicted O-methyltransferase YrrM